MKTKIVKNKIAPPFKIAEFDIMYNEGISKEADILDLGTKLELIKKSGAFYTYGEEKIGQGRENAKQYLRENHKMAKDIEKKIREMALKR